MPGNSTSVIKQTEVATHGLYVIDTLLQPISMRYEPEDFEIESRWLRQAVNLRSTDGINTFYFHVHSIGSSQNLVGKDGNDLMVDDGNGQQVSVASLLQAFVQRVQDDFVTTGEVEWRGPVEASTP
jgi:hypothetical protein